MNLQKPVKNVQKDARNVVQHQVVCLALMLNLLMFWFCWLINVFQSVLWDTITIIGFAGCVHIPVRGVLISLENV